ncbi:MAG: hypothetical protein QM706_00610 [Nitrospira sp.]
MRKTQPLSRPLSNESLREVLAAREPFAAAINSATATAAVPGTTNLPLIEPIWSFWLDVAGLTDMTTTLATRQIKLNARGALRSIPKLNLPPELIAALTAWFSDHHDGARESARAANYMAHYGLKLPSGKSSVKSSRFLDAFHAVLVDAFQYKRGAMRGTRDATVLLHELRRLHIALNRSASLIVDDLPTNEVFPRLGERLGLGRADLLIAQSLLASPQIAAALRSHILVAYPEPWMPPLDRLRQLTRTIDSLSLFYFELASTAEALFLSIRFGDWMQAMTDAAINWATFWHDDIARYLVAYREVVNVDLADE